MAGENLKTVVLAILSAILIAASAYYYDVANTSQADTKELLTELNRQKSTLILLLEAQQSNQQNHRQLLQLEAERVALLKDIAEFDAKSPTVASSPETDNPNKDMPSRDALAESVMTAEEELINLKSDYQNVITTVKQLNEQLSMLKAAATVMESRNEVQSMQEKLEKELSKAAEGNLKFMRTQLGYNDLNRDVIAYEYEEASLETALKNLPPAPAQSADDIPKPSQPTAKEATP